MLDTFCYGQTSRISPEAPIPVLRVEKEVQTLGGAANVVNNLRSLGLGVSLVGIIGTESQGQTVQKLLKEKGVRAEGLVQDHKAQTIVKNRYIAQDQQLLRVDFEETTRYPEDLTASVLAKAKQSLNDSSVLILSDYGKGVLTPNVTQSLIQEARRQKKISIVDPKGSDYGVYEGATFVTPNRKELQDATGLPTDTDDAVVTAALKLIDKNKIENILVTRSEKGMTLVQQSGGVHHFRVVAKEVYDVSGAGDTVVATLAAALSVGDTIEEAIQLANLAGTVVVGKVGTATVSLEELEDAMVMEDHRDLQESVILTLDQAMDRVAAWKERNLKVGFTNGCFDLLHLGHLKILQESRAQCDRLIVGLNTDASVSRAKGPTRPVHSEEVRSKVLSTLSCVDLVVLFEEDTPQKLIEALVPDVLVKGADYTISQVVGADIVQNNGGRVHLVELVQGQSTTSTVAKINQN